MSAYSTLKITRTDAMRLIIANMAYAEDEKLAELAFYAWGRQQLYNFTIVDSYDEDDCRPWEQQAHQSGDKSD